MKQLTNWGLGMGRAGFYALMALGVWLIWQASVAYVELGDQHPFFLEKLPLSWPSLWLAALYVHVPSALLSLPACLLLTLRTLRRRWPQAHRWLGRVTGALVLLGVVPSGLYLAWFAQGGLLTTAGFWATGLLAGAAMAGSIAAARRRDLRAHRRFATHVTAQLSVAVVSRFMLSGLESFGFYAEWAYVAALWIPVIGCAVVAELLAGPSRNPLKGRPHDQVVVGSALDPLR